MQRSKQLKENLFCLFIDLAKAYDSIPRDKLWAALLDELNLDKDLVSALKLLYVDLKARVRGDPLMTSRVINILMGVKQGCSCSPILFSIFFDRCVKAVEASFRGKTRSGGMDLINILSF
jgi:hypothetical protein